MIFSQLMVNDTNWEAKKKINKTDNNLKCNESLRNIYFKPNRQLTALTGIKQYLDVSKRRILFKAFVESQFKYYSLTWMFYRRYANNRINE